MKLRSATGRRRARGKRGPVELCDTLSALSLGVPAYVERPPIPYRHWERAVGTRIAGKARPWRLERGVLHVRVVSSVWSSELQLLSLDILAQLGGVGIKIESLRFSVGPVEALGPPPPPERYAPRPVPLPGDIVRAAERIEDDELRAAVSHAASVWLGALAPPRPPRR